MILESTPTPRTKTIRSSPLVAAGLQLVLPNIYKNKSRRRCRLEKGGTAKDNNITHSLTPVGSGSQR